MLAHWPVFYLGFVWTLFEVKCGRTAFFGISADCDIHIHILLNYISFKFKKAAYSRGETDISIKNYERNPHFCSFEEISSCTNQATS